MWDKAFGRRRPGPCGPSQARVGPAGRSGAASGGRPSANLGRRPQPGGPPQDDPIRDDSQPITAEVLHPAVNCAIVKLSSRAFPGVLLQGDTLHILYRNAQYALAGLDPATHEDEHDTLAELVEHLGECLGVYERTLARCGYSLPYVTGK
ncbi:hypothetical protein PRJ39_08010 [Lysobacter enzymogenes]|uniref:DUF6959 family protein n=1 Tax=Lysobacter enzymogenes TaxID=69 RepID=UPI00374A5B1A